MGRSRSGHRSFFEPAHILFQKGPGNDAKAGKIYSAVEIALCDPSGKARNLPVSELTGGRVRGRIFHPPASDILKRPPAMERGDPLARRGPGLGVGRMTGKIFLHAKCFIRLATDGVASVESMSLQ